MAFDRIKSSRMYDEIEEVVTKLDLDDWQVKFFRNIKQAAKDDKLTGPQREKLEEIYEIACRSPY